jgi:hypothetical protein
MSSFRSSLWQVEMVPKTEDFGHPKIVPGTYYVGNHLGRS